MHMCVSLCENVYVWVCRCPCSHISWTWSSRQFKAIQCRFWELFLGPLHEPNLLPALEAISFTHFRYFLTLHIVPFCCNFCLFHTSVHLYKVINTFLINHLPASHFIPNIHHLHRFWKLLGCLRYRFSIYSLHYFEN